MAQSGFAERLDIDGLHVECTDVMTGDKYRNRFLYYQLKMSMLKANKIDIIVSFLMESRVRMILKDLKGSIGSRCTGENPYRKLSWNYPAICLMPDKKRIGQQGRFKILQ